jgi:hypothetical protein
VVLGDEETTVLLKEVVQQAWDSIVAHRFRATLTMLGIAWGIVAVTLLLAYGNGFHTTTCRPHRRRPTVTGPRSRRSPGRGPSSPPSWPPPASSPPRSHR